MRLSQALPYAAQALLILCLLTLLAVSSQLATVWKLRAGLPLQPRPSSESTNISALQHAPSPDVPQAKIGRVYMHYGSGAQESGIPLDGFYNESMRLHLAYDAANDYRSFVLTSDMYEGVWNKVVYLATIIAEELMKPEQERLEWLWWVL